MLVPFNDPIRPPLDVSFNAAIHHVANRLNPAGFDLLPDAEAPSSLEALTEYHALHHRLAVSKDYSDKTAFGDPEVNWAFRAWHDWTHQHHQLPLTFEGENAVAWLQVGHLRDLGLWTPFRQAWLLSEVVGQAKLLRDTGSFPDDQWEFTISDLYSQGFSHNDLDQPLADPWRQYRKAVALDNQYGS